MPEIPHDLSQLSLAQIAELAAARRLPPVDQWAPTRFGDSEMRIARDGTWFHQGGPIKRENMVRLFASILRRDPDGRHFLVTPLEKLEIEVEDAPFIAVEVKSTGSGKNRNLAFRLNTGDLIIAGPANPLRFEEAQGEPHPLLGVRGGMDALVSRAAYYALADWAIDEHLDPLGLWSGGTFFPMAAT